MLFNLDFSINCCGASITSNGDAILDVVHSTLGTGIHSIYRSGAAYTHLLTSEVDQLLY